MGRTRLGIMAALALAVLASHPAKAQQARYTSETEVGVLWTDANLAKPVALTLQTYHAAQLTDYFSVGASAGYDEYFDFSVLPVGLGARGILPGRKGSWYAGMAVGCGLMWLEKNTPASWYDGGTFFNPSIGRRWKPRGQAYDRYLLNIGFKQQVLTKNTANAVFGPGAYDTEKFTLGRMSVRFGLVF